MKNIYIILFIIILCSCRKPIAVTSIDQIPGKWQWESTCGGVEYECIVSSKSRYARVEFSSDGRYIEKHNDTIFLQTTYSISKVDDMFGTLLLGNPPESLPITIMGNQLLITRGELMDTYNKIK